MQALRSCRERTQAEYWEADVAQFLAVAMEAPNDKTRNPGGLGFQHYYVSDAGLVQPATVVNYQDIARARPLKRFEKYVDTPDMAHGSRATGTTHSR